MNPIDSAWLLLKRQTKLYNWIKDYPDKEPVNYYHGSYSKVRPAIMEQGIVPQNELANNEDWFRQLDDHPDPQYHISDEEWEKMVAEHTPSTSVSPDRDYASAFGKDMWGVRGEPSGLFERHPGSIDAAEHTTYDNISPEDLVYLGVDE